MGKFDLYKISLRSLQSATQTYNYLLDNKFFNDIDGEEFKKGNLNVTVVVKKTTGAYELAFTITGTVNVPCDRCLDDVEMPVDYTGKLYVKLGKAYSEESEDIIVIPEDEGEVNIAWFLYEFAALTLPIKRVHPPGGCNKTVSGKLKKHSASDVSDGLGDEEIEADLTDIGLDEDEKTTDPRWDKLKDINFES